jgi:hypothetical protein
VEKAESSPQKESKEQIKPFLYCQAPRLRKKEGRAMSEVLQKEKIFPVRPHHIRKAKHPGSPDKVQPKEEIIVWQRSEPAASPKANHTLPRVKFAIIGHAQQNAPNQVATEHEEQLHTDDGANAGPVAGGPGRPGMSCQH